MKANELMIGDWVYRPDCYDKVKEIRQNGIIGLDSLRGLIGFSELKPIPLTQEILEKYGFVEKSERCWVLSDEYTGNEVLVLYEVANAFAMFTSGLAIGFQNVHELQHVLKLHGIEEKLHGIEEEIEL